MAVVSISLNEKMIREADRLQDELGYSGRSEVVRSALRLLLNEQRSLENIQGNVDAVLILINREKGSDEVSEIRHKHNRIIKTEVHNHLSTDKCMHIFVLQGNANEVKEIAKRFEASKKIEYSKLFVS